MPRTEKYSGDSGKHSGAPSVGPTGVPTEHDDGQASSDQAFKVDAEVCISTELVEQYHKFWERENREPDPHKSSFDSEYGGSKTPYADEHAPESGPETPGPKKGSS